MFNFFRKKEKSIPVIDKIFMSETAKWKAMVQHAGGNSPSIFIFWFEDTMKQAELFFNSTNYSSNIFLAREITSHHIHTKNVFFGEHYPLQSKERALYQKLNLQTAIVFSALTEPLYQQIIGGKLIELMKRMGMEDDSVIEHKMVAKAISNVQRKLEKKVLVETSASSQKSWMDTNLQNQNSYL